MSEPGSRSPKRPEIRFDLARIREFGSFDFDWMEVHPGMD
jgi:hypothetical protein